MMQDHPYPLLKFLLILCSCVFMLIFLPVAAMYCSHLHKRSSIVDYTEKEEMMALIAMPSTANTPKVQDKLRRAKMAEV